jgi:hypothetical protein
MRHAMQFHEYTSLRNAVAQKGKTPQYRQHARGLKPQGYRDFVLDLAKKELGPEWEASETALAAKAKTVLAERQWVENLRPFYNIWPIVTDLAQSVKLDLPFSAVEPRFKSIVLRFARGHEPALLTTALLSWSKSHVLISCPLVNKWFTMEHSFRPNDKVEDWLTTSDARDETTDAPEVVRDFIANDKTQCDLLVRLFVFVGLLSHNDGLITPIVLAKDQERYAETDDPDIRNRLEDRAARRVGRGFDVGKSLQLEREKSPHWRNPHLCLFWTGTGRRKPLIKMRSGAVIKRPSMVEVPTGYLGPEADDE